MKNLIGELWMSASGGALKDEWRGSLGGPGRIYLAKEGHSGTEGTAHANTWCQEQSTGHLEDSPHSVPVLPDLSGRDGCQATAMPKSCS